MRSTHPDDRLPIARTTGLSINDLGGEILVYDRDTDTAHCLGETAALVWRACDGKLAIQALIDRETLDPETVQQALADLGELGLLDSAPVRVQKVSGGISRRQAVGRLAAAAVGPLVVSVAAPAAWAAVSTRNKTVCGSGGAGAGQCPAGTVGCQNCNAPSPSCGAVCASGTSTTCATSTGAQCLRDCCPVGYSCSAAGSGNGTCLRSF